MRPHDWFYMPHNLKIGVTRYYYTVYVSNVASPCLPTSSRACTTCVIICMSGSGRSLCRAPVTGVLEKSGRYASCTVLHDQSYPCPIAQSDIA